MNDIFKYFTTEIRQALEKENFNDIEEIRLRVNRNIIVKTMKKQEILNKKITSSEIIRILQNICENSIYSYQRKIAEGFITLKGGHRVGISGSAVIEDNKIININHIFSLNFRIAREVKGSSFFVKKYIENENGIYNTIIFSSPGKGKTTILRDLIREFSKDKNVGVVDERSELCSMYMGIPQNDIGDRVDILENVKKSVGLKMLVRTMAPQIVIADEIGTLEDIEAINYAVSSGVYGIFTAHGNDFNKIKQNPIIEVLLNKKLIQRIIFLNEVEKGKVKEVYDLKDNEYVKVEG